MTPHHRYERQLLALNNFVTDMVHAHEIPELVDKVNQAGETILGAEGCGVYLLSANKKSIAELYSKNVSAACIERLASDLHHMPGQTALRTRQPVVIPDVLKDNTYGKRIQFTIEYGVKAMFILPVTFLEESIGILAFYYQQPHVFTDTDVELGQTLARTLSITLQNIHLYQAQHYQRQFAEALAQAAVALNSSLDPDEVLDQILDQTLRVTGCRSVNIMLIEDERALVVRNLDHLALDPHGSSPTKELALSTPTLKQMLETGEPLIIPNTQDYPAWRTLETSSWIASYAGAPLRIQQEVLGFLNMNSDQVDFFNQEIIQRLEAFAATAAAAIQNARLFSNLQQYSQQLEQRVSERTAELSTAKERIETILVSVPDAVFVLDDHHQLVQANPAGESLKIMAEQEGLDLFASNFLVPLIEGRLSEEKAVVEVQDRAYQALASPIPNPGRRSGLVVVFRDVTRFRELDQMKTRFVSDVSHELRTPLANLSIYLDLLMAIDDKERSKEYLATLRRETDRLTHLIEDLLTISRLEAGRIEIDIQPVDVVNLVQNLAEDRAPMAAQQELTLTHSSAPGLPLAYADPRLLTQALSNLLTNAFNYTSPLGSIHMRTDMTQGADNCWVTISVKDTGVGIPPEEMDKLFVRFFRGTASEKTASSGTGLGLAISKEIIDRLGGQITVESQPDRGSNFIVWLRAVL